MSPGYAMPCWHRRRNHVFTVAQQHRKLIYMYREAARARLVLLTNRLATHRQSPHVVFKPQSNLLSIWCMQDAAVIGVLGRADAKFDVISNLHEYCRDMMQFVAFFAMMFWPCMRMR